jgi:hypothetical protein
VFDRKKYVVKISGGGKANEDNLCVLGVGISQGV